MKKILLILALLIFLPRPLLAADALVPIPKNLQEFWVMGDCETGRLAYRFSDHFLLMSIKQGSKLFRVGGVHDVGNGHYQMKRSGEMVEYVLGSAGDLLQFPVNIKTSFSVAGIESGQIKIPHITFKNCGSAKGLPITEDVVMRDLLPGLDKIHQACPTPEDIYNDTCLGALFTLFDRSGDDVLDETEMTYAWDTALSKQSTGTCGPVRNVPGDIDSGAAPYVGWMLANADKNQDRTISFTEIKAAWQGLYADPLMSVVVNSLIAIARPFSILPEPLKATCVNCCLGSGQTP